MGQIDMNILGGRIREARQRAALSQGELAQAAKIDRTALTKIENGTRKVTALELADIAEATGVRMIAFFEETLPALISHRSSTGLDTADSQIDALLARLAGDVELVSGLSSPQDLHFDTAKHVAERGQEWQSLVNEAEDWAQKIRELMELTSHEPITDLANRVSYLGLLAFSRDIGPDTADAGITLLRQGGVCLVNSSMKVGRRRLALAHELGHYLLADEYTIDWRVSSSTSSSRVETQLDRFARALLLPAEETTRKWKSWRSGRGERSAALLLASEYRVDMSTLAFRLQELNLIDSECASSIREYRQTRADMVELDLYVPEEEMRGTTVPKVYAKTVLKLVRQEKISRVRAIDLLLNTFEEADLPNPRERHPEEIWKYVS
ncbi:MAG: XRE family transcriptional regulator [Ancrocorticia sp.]